MYVKLYEVTIDGFEPWKLDACSINEAIQETIEVYGIGFHLEDRELSVKELSDWYLVEPINWWRIVETSV